MIENLGYTQLYGHVTNFLIGKSLYEFVSSEEKKPELSDPATANELKTWKEWNAKDKKVMDWLSAVIDNTMLGHIRNAESSHPACYV